METAGGNGAPEIEVVEMAAGRYELWSWRAAEPAREATETIVMLHAAASHPGAFRGLVEALRSPGRRFLAPALNGYGSSHVGAGSPLERHLAIAADVLNRPRPAGRLVLFGHSMGGLVALLAAAECAAIDALALYDPIVTGVLDPQDGAQRRALEWDRGIIGTLTEAVRAGKPEPGLSAFVQGWNETRWDALPEAVRSTLLKQAQRLAADAEMVSYFELAPATLAALEMPVLVLHGAHSPAIIGHIQAMLVPRLSAGTSREVGSCGHMGPLLDGQRVAAAMDDLLS